MTTQAWLILTPAACDAVLALNEPESGVAVIPREIDNPLANNLGEGTLVGKFVAPARVLNDAEYSAYYALCSTMPIRTMDSDVLFVPPPEL